MRTLSDLAATSLDPVCIVSGGVYCRVMEADTDSVDSDKVFWWRRNWRSRLLWVVVLVSGGWLLGSVNAVVDPWLPGDDYTFRYIFLAVVFVASYISLRRNIR